jgi:hypothetical protein
MEWNGGRELTRNPMRSIDGWIDSFASSRFLLLVSYTMIFISFAKQQSCEVLKKKRYQDGSIKIVA